MNTIPRLVTAREVAAATSLSVRAVYDLAQAGLIPYYRFGRSLRFDLEEVLAACRVELGARDQHQDLSDAELYEMLGLGSAA